jgi:hypothetical protein
VSRTPGRIDYYRHVIDVLGSYDGNWPAEPDGEVPGARIVVPRIARSPSTPDRRASTDCSRFHVLFTISLLPRRILLEMIYI